MPNLNYINGALPAGIGGTPVSPLAYGIADAVRASGVSRTRLYEALTNGDLAARKAGRRTLIEADELRRWIASQPRAEFRAAPQKAA